MRDGQPTIELLKVVNEFDGQHIGDLKDYCARHPATQSILDALIDLAATRDESLLQTAATWMLKDYWEKGVVLGTEQSHRLLKAFDRFNNWEAHLHLLQMLEGLTFDGRRARRLWSQCEQLRQDDNKLIRAWALHGLCQVAARFSKFEKQAVAACKEAAEDDSAAVRARARRLLKERFQ